MIAVTICLSLFLIIILIKYITLKKQLRSFGRQIKLRGDVEYNRPINVDGFDRDIVELAVRLNEHTDIQRLLGIEYKQNKERLNNIISGISHDFCTPLTASLGYLQMIKKSGELSEKNAKYLDIAIGKNISLKELSDEFFELSKSENSKKEPAAESINLSNLISDMVMEQYGWMQERGITPDFDICDGIVTESSRLYITRIAQNLLSNAEKYAFKRFGVLLSENNGRIVFSVFNDTDGKTNIDINRVFEPFYTPSSRNEGGSGLGLYVVKRMSEKLGAQTAAELDGKGIFRITIIF